MSSALFAPPASSEIAFVAEGVAQNCRGDGRQRLQQRTMQIQTGCILSAHGSAAVCIGGGDGTRVVASVKGEIGAPAPGTSVEGVIHASVEVSPTAGRIYAGRDAEEENANLSSALLQILKSSPLNLQDLCIIPGLQVWHLHVDAVVMDANGSILDAVSIAARAALLDTKLPVVQVIQAEGVASGDVELSDDPRDIKPLDMKNAPVCVTLSRIDDRYVIDATELEEQCSDSRFSFGVSATGNIVYIHKGGAGRADPSQVQEMMTTAKRAGMGIAAKMDEVLATMKPGEEIFL